MGTVMGWVDKKGVRHQTLVLDAAYRGGRISYGNTANTSATGTYTGSSFGLTNTAITSQTTASAYPLTSKTDAQINNSTSGYFEDSYTGKHNTTSTMNQFNCSTSSAIGFCYNKYVNINGVNQRCCLPNIQTLIRICCSIYKLDELDPSNRSTYKSKFFTRAVTGTNNFADDVYSSTEGSSGEIWWINSDSGYSGIIERRSKTITGTTIPVYEIS